MVFDDFMLILGGLIRVSYNNIILIKMNQRVFIKHFIVKLVLKCAHIRDLRVVYELLRIFILQT